MVSMELGVVRAVRLPESKYGQHAGSQGRLRERGEHVGARILGRSTPGLEGTLVDPLMRRATRSSVDALMGSGW